jgi:hypothetical protein
MASSIRMYTAHRRGLKSKKDPPLTTRSALPPKVHHSPVHVVADVSTPSSNPSRLGFMSHQSPQRQSKHCSQAKLTTIIQEHHLPSHPSSIDVHRRICDPCRGARSPRQHAMLMIPGSHSAWGIFRYRDKKMEVIIRISYQPTVYLSLHRRRASLA